MDGGRMKKKKENITLSTIYFMMNVYLSKKFMATFKSNDAGKFHEILI